MTFAGLAYIVFYFLVILALMKPLGSFMAKVYQGQRTFLHPVLRPWSDWPTACVASGKMPNNVGRSMRVRCWRLA